MSLVDVIQANAGTLYVWSARGDSTVGFAEMVSARIRITILNKKQKKPLFLTEQEFNQGEWLVAPRMDIKWMNVGSRWYDRRRKMEVWNITNGPSSAGIVILEPVFRKRSHDFSSSRKGLSCFDLMTHTLPRAHTQDCGEEAGGGPHEPHRHPT